MLSRLQSPGPQSPQPPGYGSRYGGYSSSSEPIGSGYTAQLPGPRRRRSPGRNNRTQAHPRHLPAPELSARRHRSVPGRGRRLVRLQSIQTSGEKSSSPGASNWAFLRVRSRVCAKKVNQVSARNIGAPAALAFCRSVPGVVVLAPVAAMLFNCHRRSATLRPGAGRHRQHGWAYLAPISIGGRALGVMPRCRSWADGGPPRAARRGPHPHSRQARCCWVVASALTAPLMARLPWRSAHDARHQWLSSCDAQRPARVH